MTSSAHHDPDGRTDDEDVGIRLVEYAAPEPRHLLTLLPTNDAFADGIIPEAIVGRLRRPLEDGESIRPEDFQRNQAFVDFMQEFIARRGPELEELRDAARRQRDGWIFVLDARTATPEGRVPPHDIVGAFAVEGGRLVAGSYRRNDGHALLSPDGFFRLPPQLQSELVKELVDRNSASRSQGIGLGER